MSVIMRFGLDLAKQSFAVCGVDARDNVVLRKTLKRSDLLAFFAQQSPATIAMESGSGAHHWARCLARMGHDPRIIDPRLVAPYRSQGKTGKNDLNDAMAICEAAGRPHMRFVPIKSEDQQAVLVIHRLRSAAVTAHTRTINQLRGLLAEFGVIAPRGADRFKRDWHELRQAQAQALPPLAWEAIDDLYAELSRLHDKVLSFDRQIYAFVRDCEPAQRLAEVPGIGRLTASAIVATIGNGRDFKNGRQFAAWLGLVPRQHSTGGQAQLGRITKNGDVYLRTLIIQGARSDLIRSKDRLDAKGRWAAHLKTRKHWNVAAVALANKHARIAWSILANQQRYQPT